MADIHEAKRNLLQKYRSEDGFVGVGIGKEAEEKVLILYTMAAMSELLNALIQAGEFEGFRIKSSPTGEINASGAIDQLS